MWKDYSADYIKNNRSSSFSVRLSAFISALLLSLLCGLFYNAWKYEVERIEREEGGWQSRIIGEFDKEDLEAIKNFASVKDVVVTNAASFGGPAYRNEKESKGAEMAADIYFDDYGVVFSDTHRIAELIEISPEKIIYNYELLAMYLIRDEEDTAPRLIFPMFILIMALASFSLIVIIHNSFSVSMNARIHQFGIFSSIGATPKQIRACLLHEAAVLCALPVLAGNLLGIAGSMGLIQLLNILLEDNIPGRHKSVPGYHPLVLIVTLLLTVITIWISAWLPARKLSRVTPLEAIKNTGELQLNRKKEAPILTLLFGMEGELAKNALAAQKRALRTASLSLIFSFMAFTIMQCFFTLSGISTKETYFERYKDAWDIIVTVKDTELDAFDETEAVGELTGVRNAVVYQKAAAKRIISEEEMSGEMKSFGGFSHASGNYVTQVDGGWLVNAPVVILDDNSFLAYCEQIGIAPRIDGAVIRNQICDVTNPDFRHPDFVPYIKEPDNGENAVSVLRQSGNEEMTAEVPILAYTEEVPVLREEYASIDYYELVHFMPVSLWKEIKRQAGGMEEDIYIRVLGRENVTLEELDTLQREINQLVSQKYTAEFENRIQEYETNDKQIQGMMAIFGGFCVLLAVIGIGNVFSNTMGFVHQRKREFARYMSVGMTPKEIKKMFCIEALVLAVRPVLPALFLSAAAVGYMLKMSYLAAGEFLAEAPFIPVAVFMLAVLGSVALAYSLAWRNVRKISLAQVLKDDTMM
ncbi:MAG: ABC transporter permease [Lachnospiraceae bacterium]|nr:ABC transporter permease [Lachnospiraceae bacterium]